MHEETPKKLRVAGFLQTKASWFVVSSVRLLIALRPALPRVACLSISVPAD
jgi:hypothetical protein